MPDYCDITIDVSRWQGLIDWPKVFAAGKRLAIIKATQGIAGVDPNFVKNSTEAKAAGLLVVPYHFLDSSDGAKQAAHFLSVAGLIPGSLAAIDWEGKPSSTASPAQAEACGEIVRAATRRAPLGYWGMFPPGKPTTAMLAWPRWVPRYGHDIGVAEMQFTPPPPWSFWQYTSKAKVAGIAGNTVDTSLFAGTAAQLVAFVIGGTAHPAPLPVPPVKQNKLAIDLQTTLKANGLYDGDLDGIWGPQSKAALAAAVKAL